MATNLANNENFVFNGFDFKKNIEMQGWTFIVNNTRGRGIFGKEIQTKKVVGVDGVSVLDSSLPSRTIEVDYTLKTDSLRDLRMAESFITILLQHDEITSLSFADQEGFYHAYFENISVSYEDANLQQGTITFFCPKPFRYKGMVTAFENRNVKAQVFELVNTESNYFSLPIIEIIPKVATKTVEVIAGDGEIALGAEIKAGDKIVFDSEKMEVRHNGTLKVVEVNGVFPKLYTILNGVKVNVDCSMTLKYKGVDV